MDDGPAQLVPAGAQPLGIVEESLAGKVRKIVAEGTAPNTKRAYASDLRYWSEWCRLSHIDAQMPLSPLTVVRFLAEHVEGLDDELDEDLVRAGVKQDLGRLSISTVARRLAAMATAHKMAGCANPCADPQVRELLAMARRAAARGGWAPKKKTAVPLEIMEKMLATCGDDLRDVRDRALLLFAWSSGGRRRSEVTTAVMDRLERIGDDFVYRLGITKTSQDGDSGSVPVAGRAAEALAEWLRRSGVEEGPIFRAVRGETGIGDRRLSDIAVARIVKKRIRLAGLDPEKFSGHSLRSGFMTEAGLQGIGLTEAMGMSLHKSVQIASGYHQAGAGVKNKAARLLG